MNHVPAGGERPGNNAKSTFVKILSSSLGSEYSIRGKNPLLYKNDSISETVNTHDAGLLVYKGRRMVFFEKLDPKRRLNDGFLKVQSQCLILTPCGSHNHLYMPGLQDINGGNTPQQARGCNEKNPISFTWTAKQLLCFNAGNMPSECWTVPA